MEQWANVANLEFVATGSDHSDIWYWVVDDATATSLFGPGILGIHEVPGYSDGLPLYGAFNNGGEGWTDAGLTIGGLGFATLIHELGHGLGLAHPHDGGDAPDASLFPGVTSEFDDYGDYDLNQGIWTTMSYNDGWPSAFPSPSHDFGHQLTPMALDIAAIQLIYGANRIYQSGDDVVPIFVAERKCCGLGLVVYLGCRWNGYDLCRHCGERLQHQPAIRATSLERMLGGTFLSRRG